MAVRRILRLNKTLSHSEMMRLSAAAQREEGWFDKKNDAQSRHVYSIKIFGKRFRKKLPAPIYTLAISLTWPRSVWQMLNCADKIIDDCMKEAKLVREP